MRRLIITFVAIVTLVPVAALAVFPLAILPGVALAFESGTMAASYAAAVTLIGAAVVALSFSTPSAPSSPPIYARLSPSAPVPVPAGWTAGPDGADPVPPTSEPIPGAAFPPSSGGQRCTIYFSSGSGSWLDGCGHIDSTMEECWSSFASAGSSDTYIRYCIQIGGEPDAAGNRLAVKSGAWPTAALSNLGAGLSPVSGDSTCPYGSVLVAGQCVGNPDATFPPDGMLVVNYQDGGFSVHPKDTADAAAIPVTLTGGALSSASGGSSSSITPRSGGGLNVESRVVQDDGKTKVTQYELTPGAGDKLVLSGGSESYVSGAGSAVGGGTQGDSDTDVAACGGVGQPACQIDDSGFNGKGDHTGDVAMIGAALDAQKGTLEGVADIDIGVNADWLPNLMPGARLACTALVYEPAITHGPAAGFGGRYELDLCDKLAVVREIIGWTIGIFTAIYVFRVFFRSNTGH